ncbi:hypothetical protein [Aeromicrobium terrae]|uniref:C-type lectin domain-containing protein n=1 Tax=Aeromicrobium terrae TaxID=2498846 RepID=A0A5C8NLF7_9ACTN|nr:hypothetical protein [Aeromicrobium terrae]TXL61313.1 hypothetical protein FHP06_07740 [Aeromicrobium terrae]
MRSLRWTRHALVTVAAVLLVVMSAPAAQADTDDVPAPPSPTAPCDALSPIAIPCILLNKVVDAVGAECRRVNIPDALCTLPLAHRVTQAARDAYLQSWAHQVAQFQYRLGDPLPLRDAQWIGTHNSFNSLADSFTVSHADSNQQLSLTQQLDIDVRSIELDLHFIPRLELLGARGVTVCHGQGPELGDLGCTFEPLFTKVLPKIAGWLNAHPDEVVLLYLEDEMKNAKAYPSVISTLDSVLKRPNGSSLIYRPKPADKAANGCAPMPLGVSRDDIRAAGAQVMLVGNCVPGWSADVFDWDTTHVESGSTSGYQPFPQCDATYGDDVYASQLVRYFEDTTLVSALLNPTRPPVDPEALTPKKVHSMTQCGVNLFGLDQILPEDGRIQATLWSWAPDEPKAGAGECTLQNADGRWVAAPCADPHPAACSDNGSTWTLTEPVAFADASAACAGLGSEFSLPRAGDQNARLHAAAGASGAWIDYAIP